MAITMPTRAQSMCGLRWVSFTIGEYACHGGRRVPDDAAGASCIGRSGERRDIPDVDAREQRMGERSADGGARDVVEERRQNEHDRQEHERALQVVGQEVRQRQHSTNSKGIWGM